jgi:hypothetical protein
MSRRVAAEPVRAPRAFAAAVPALAPRALVAAAPLRAFAVFALLAALAPRARAAAQCAESTPSAGVVLLACRVPGRAYTVVRADLAAADVAVRVSTPAERGLTPDAFAGALAGPVVVVPGGPFSFPGLAPVGLTVGEGTAWSDGRDDGVLGVLALDARGAGLVADARALVPAEGWMHSVVSGVPVLVDGVPVAQCTGRGCERAPRTGAGLSADGRTLVIVAARGWAEDVPGVTDAELGELMREAGAARALRLADGATSALWARGGVGAVPSSDGAPRPVAALLAVVDRASGATSRIRGVVKDVATDAVLPAARVRITTTDGAVVWEGGTLTSGAYWERTLPVREYLVQAELGGYRTGCKHCATAAGADTWCSLFLERGAGAERCVVPERRVEAGPWPLAPAPPAAPADAGLALPPRAAASGCSVVPGATARRATGPRATIGGGGAGAGGAGAGGVGLYGALLIASRAVARRRRVWAAARRPAPRTAGAARSRRPAPPAAPRRGLRARAFEELPAW